MNEHDYTCIATAKDARPWNTNSEGLRQIFCAALQGIIANPEFFGPEYQGRIDLAINFADSVVADCMTLTSPKSGV